MSTKLIISLIVFAIVWLVIIIYNIRHKKISVKYSLCWLLSSCIILLVGCFPSVINEINRIFGFEVVSNLVVGMLITLLMIITFILTIIVTKQKEQIKTLIQEVSILQAKEK